MISDDAIQLNPLRAIASGERPGGKAQQKRRAAAHPPCAPTSFFFDSPPNPDRTVSAGRREAARDALGRWSKNLLHDFRPASIPRATTEDDAVRISLSRPTSPGTVEELGVSGARLRGGWSARRWRDLRARPADRSHFDGVIS